jgi:hypothetical protein
MDNVVEQRAAALGARAASFVVFCGGALDLQGQAPS